MIECPNCKALNSDDSLICGACGEDISKVKREPKSKASGEVHLKNVLSDDINQTIRAEYKKSEEKKAKLEPIIILVVSILCWLFIPIPIVKLVFSVIVFLLAEHSQNKKSVLLLIAKIICVIQVVIAMVLLVLGLINM